MPIADLIIIDRCRRRPRCVPTAPVVSFHAQNAVPALHPQIRSRLVFRGFVRANALPRFLLNRSLG